MSRILIINFDETLTIPSLRIINKIRSNPLAEVHYLTYEDNPLREYLNFVEKVHTIDRKKIKKLTTKKLFEGSHVVNYVYKLVSELKKMTWTHIHCLSLDQVSLNFHSYIASKTNTHLILNEHRSFSSQNFWSIFRFYIEKNIIISPLNLTEVIAKEYKIKSDSTLPLRVNDEYTQVANQNFLRIRKKIKEGNIDKKIIGIQFYSKSTDCNIEDHELISLVSQLQESKHFYPVIIINKNEAERDLIDFLNSAFSQKTITIDTDYSALPAVLKNIDCFITVDKIALQIADSCDSPSIYITNANELRKFGSCISNNFSIIKNSGESGLSLSLVKFLRYQTGVDYKLIESDYNCFSSQNHDGNIGYHQISGELSISELVTSYINKAFVYSKESSTTYIENDLISLISKIDITEWKKTENEKFTLVLRDLLTCIRCLRMTKDSLSHTRKFLLALEALLEHGDLASITQIPILLFRSRVEQIQSGNKLTNLNQFEAHLFELKDDLNLINSIMGQLSNKKPTARSINI